MPNMPAMHPRTRELLDHLEHCLADLRDAVDAVPAPLRERQPAADRWSIAQIVEHLAHTASQVAALLDRGLRKLEKAGLRPAGDGPPVLPTIDQTRLLDRERKVTAPPTVQPKGALTFAEAWEVLTTSRQAVVDALRAGDGIDVAAIRAPHAALGELSFHQWVAFVGLHERRHAAQIRATAKALQE